MCGIIGFAGKTEAVPILLDGLERLEYRGYDSAGVAVASADGRLQVKKSKGRLSVLRGLLESQTPLSGNIGIGHTRWATHGEPNDTNAHPHVGQEGKIAVAHNGIIENYLEIKNSLIRKGVVFSSDTDTEVIVQLLEYYYRKKSNLMDTVYAVLNRIKGAYAMGILCSDFPGQMVAARKDSPLLIGYGQDGNYIASDVTALLAHTRTVTCMEDDEVAVVTADQVQIFDRDRFLMEKEKHLIDWDVSAAEKGGYVHSGRSLSCIRVQIHRTVTWRIGTCNCNQQVRGNTGFHTVIKTVRLYMNPIYKLFRLSGKLDRLKNHILPSRGMFFL